MSKMTKEQKEIFEIHEKNVRVDPVKNKVIHVPLLKISQIIDEQKNGNSNRFFSVEFRRRTDCKKTGAKAGDIRKMNCLPNVKKHLKGGTLPYDADDHGLVILWIPEQDRRPGGKDNGYRAVPIDSIISVTVNGVKYVAM